MSTVRQSSGPGSRWWLAVLLALIIIGVIAGAVLLPRLTKKSAHPTATARVIVVTSSPTPGSPKVTVVVTATSTSPGGSSTAVGGGSTPLPGASPVPSVTGLKLGMITRPISVVNNDQAQADKGNPAYTYYLDPRQVVLKNLPTYGFTGGFTITNPAAPSPSPTPHIGADKRNVIRFLVSYGGQTYTVAVAQPGRQGPKGVWVIVTILKGSHIPS
jgi:hypothetical protein